MQMQADSPLARVVVYCSSMSFFGGRAQINGYSFVFRNGDTVLVGQAAGHTKRTLDLEYGEHLVRFAGRVDASRSQRGAPLANARHGCLIALTLTTSLSNELVASATAVCHEPRDFNHPVLSPYEIVGVTVATGPSQQPPIPEAIVQRLRPGHTHPRASSSGAVGSLLSCCATRPKMARTELPLPASRQFTPPPAYSTDASRTPAVTAVPVAQTSAESLPVVLGTAAQ